MSSFPNRENSSTSWPVNNANPLAFLVPVIVLGILVMLLAGRRRPAPSRAAGSTAGKARAAARNSSRRALVSMIIALLENDVARRGVIMGLKMVRSRL